MGQKINTDMVSIKSSFKSQGYLLSRQWFDTPQGLQLTFWFHCASGPIKVIVTHQVAVFFVSQHDFQHAQNALARLLGDGCYFSAPSDTDTIRQRPQQWLSLIHI